METLEKKSVAVWTVDPSHSELLFKVKHLMITNVKGEFRKFDITSKTGETDFSESEIVATIDASSVFTNNTDRDNHLKSADFLDAENHREIIFKSHSFQKNEDGNFILKGDLTIKGVTREVLLDVEFGGINKDPWGNEKAGFSVSGKINRKDWGLNWNAALETGGVLVSEEVKINAEVQLVRKG
ncbi:MAG: YceI family protein [Bacteroidota bacterium]